jgi:1,2-diacylglycerol-3-alpha-glucose alpha-1,2-galactosyltransferase
MTVSMISETEYFAKDHGVHTAYLTMVDMLREQNQNVIINSSKKADIVHVQTIGPYALLKLSMGKKTVATAHLIPDSFVGSLRGANYWKNISGRYLRFFYNHADLVLAVSPYVKDQLVSLGVRKQIEVLPNPVNSKKFKKDPVLKKKGKAILKIDDKSFVIIGVGQLQPRKGIADFIKLARMNPSFIFLWIGSRPFKSLTSENTELNNELAHPPGNFLIRGPFDYREMPMIYNAADIFLFPSYQENAPMGVLEAASTGLPLILRDNPEYKRLYKKGYLAGKDISGFQTNIDKLYKSKEQYKKQSLESEKLARNFAADALGRKLIKMYNSLITL